MDPMVSAEVIASMESPFQRGQRVLTLSCGHLYSHSGDKPVDIGTTVFCSSCSHPPSCGSCGLHLIPSNFSNFGPLCLKCGPIGLTLTTKNHNPLY
jgi:hypothetical protein